MAQYRFTLFIPKPILTHNQILAVTEALERVGCKDASIFGYKEGFELVFNRAADSPQAAISAVIAQVECAGFSVAHVELEEKQSEKLSLFSDA